MKEQLKRILGFFGIAYDKFLHLIAGFGIVLFLHLIGVHLYLSLAISMAVGYAKEYVWDIRFPEKHTVDIYDFIYTCVGGLIYVLVDILI